MEKAYVDENYGRNLTLPADVPDAHTRALRALIRQKELALLLGAVGIPVFAGFSGGVGCLLGSTGGYLVGFLFTALVMWAMERLMGKKLWVLALSMLLGLVVCYAFGTVWFILVYARTTGEIGLLTALGWCVFPYILPDLIKMALALVLCRRLAGVLKLR